MSQFLKENSPRTAKTVDTTSAATAIRSARDMTEGDVLRGRELGSKDWALEQTLNDSFNWTVWCEYWRKKREEEKRRREKGKMKRGRQKSEQSMMKALGRHFFTLGTTTMGNRDLCRMSRYLPRVL